MSETPAGSFGAKIDRSLKRLGLAGSHADVWLDGDTLCIREGQKETLAIPVGDIERMRVGIGPSGNRGSYETRLSIKGVDWPLVLIPWYRREDYAVTMRALANAVLAKRGMAALERGTSQGSAIGYAAFNAVAAVAMLAGAIYGALNEVWINLFFLLPAALFAFQLFHGLSSQRPRPLQSLDELDKLLPSKAPAPAPTSAPVS